MAKFCVGCKKTKPDTAFRADGRFKDGMANSCTACEGGKEYALETVDLREVEIAAADVTVYGAGSPPEGDTYTIADLERIAADSNAVSEDLRPPVKIGHDRKQRLLRASGLWGEEPRTGTLKNFKMKGDKLVADIVGMPKKLADLVPSAFRLRSMELGPARSQRTNESYDTVVKGLALLGATTPAFQTLDDIHAMYAGVDHEPTARLLLADQRLEDDDSALITNYAVGDVIWDDEDGVNDIMRDISDAINPQPAGAMDPYPCPRYWVMDLQLIDVDGDGDVPGPRALIGEYGNGAAWVVPVTFDADGEPQVPPAGEWVLAEQAWVQVSDGPDDGGSTDMHDRETRERADTTGIVKVKIGDKTLELADLDENQVKSFAELFGLEGDDATPGKVYEAIAARSETPSPDPEPPAPAPPAPDDGNGFTVGGKTYSESEFAEIVARAERGDKAFEQMRVDRRESFLKGLVRDGKVNPANLEQLRKDYDENEAMTRRFCETLPVQDELVRIFGDDATGLEFSNEDEQIYRAYCANQGIPYEMGGRQ